MNNKLSCFDIQARVMDWIRTDQPGFDVVRDRIISMYGTAISPEIAGQIRAVEYERTLSDLKDWLRNLIKATPPPKRMRAIYFGMVDFMPHEDSPVEYVQFYVDGSPTFDPDDEGEWACECDWTYGSPMRYPVCSTFVEYAKLCNDGEELMTFTFSQALTACIAIELAPVFSECLKFKKHKQLPVAVGHDSGDIYLIGAVSRDGFVPSA